MADIKTLKLDVKVVIGDADLTMGDFLRLGRGSVIALTDPQSRQFDRNRGDHRVTITANGYPVANASVAVHGAEISVRVLD